MMIWMIVHPQADEQCLGFVPAFFNDRDPRSAREQLDANYQHGGGFMPDPAFRMMRDGRLAYPGDPPLELLAETRLRDEIIRLYECEFLAIIQPDGSYEVTRCD